MIKKIIYNKRGFTLIEIMIAVSIFGIISLMTFSIFQFVPRAAKAESIQYSERDYVRRAVAEITRTIQNAALVANPPLKFTMPGGEEIEYESYSGNVNKVVDGVASRLMESIDEFSITPVGNHLFEIHIKTSNEGAYYDFKVERRRGGRIKTNAEISSISPETAVFDKNILNQQDISITLNLNGNDLNWIRNDTYILNPMTDYSISGNILTLKKEYLKTQPNGIIHIVFDVSSGKDPVLSVEIIDSSTFIKIEGNSYEDDLARMKYPGDMEIDPCDNRWIICVTNGTVSDDFDSDDLSVTGLPTGLIISAAKEPGNKVSVTLSGITAAPVDSIRTIGIIIKGSGAIEPGALDSEPITVFLLPGATFASPEHNIIFTNEIVFNNNVTIEGDIVIGRDSSMTTIQNNCNINGYLYVDSSLTTNNNTIIGSPTKNKKVFVKGSAIFNNNVEIYGDLYYRDTIVTKNVLKVTGEIKKTPVEIPPVSIPSLKPDQWYIDNGYTIVNSPGTVVNLENNGKYFFNTRYTFNSDLSGLENVTIVGKNNFVFNNQVSCSGIIFTPNGLIEFNNNVNFTGVCISKSTILNNNCTLKFRRYPEMPFD